AMPGEDAHGRRIHDKSSPRFAINHREANHQRGSPPWANDTHMNHTNSHMNSHTNGRGGCAAAASDHRSRQAASAPAQASVDREAIATDTASGEAGEATSAPRSSRCSPSVQCTGTK